MGDAVIVCERMDGLSEADAGGGGFSQPCRRRMSGRELSVGMYKGRYEVLRGGRGRGEIPIALRLEISDRHVFSAAPSGGL
jgi:hypothetical protein